jgi:hypothetical protein
MIKLFLFLSLALFVTGCVNRHGISAKYYSDCKEYYDMQGYYHKKCGDDDIVTYKAMRDALKKKETQPKGNVW